MNDRRTDITQFVAELNGGAFQSQIEQAINDTALAVVEHGRVGKVTITLNFKKISNLNQVDIKHALKFAKPTMRGTVTEDLEASTPMYVGKGGKVTIFHESQMDMLQPDAPRKA